jgi:transposase
MIEREIVKAYSGKSKEQALALTLRIRQEKSKPIVEELGRRAMQIRALCESPIGRAVRDLQNQWTGLIRFLDHSGIPLTSNLAEAALRCLVLGRNNHFGSRSKRGTEVAAMFYSLIESARLGLDPRAYRSSGAGRDRSRAARRPSSDAPLGRRGGEGR